MKLSIQKMKTMIGSTRRQTLAAAGSVFAIALGILVLGPFTITSPGGQLGPSQVYGKSLQSETRSATSKKAKRAGVQRLKELHGPMKNTFRAHPVSDRLSETEGKLRELRDTSLEDIIDFSDAGYPSIATGYESAVLHTLDLLRQLDGVLKYQIEMELHGQVDQKSVGRPLPRSAAQADRWNHELLGLLEATKTDLDNHFGILTEHFEQVEIILRDEWKLKDQLGVQREFVKDFEKDHKFLEQKLEKILAVSDLHSLSTRVEGALQFLEPKVVDPKKIIKAESPSVFYREPVQAPVLEASEDEIQRAMGLVSPGEAFSPTSPPASADTLETTDVQITVEIQALADSLGSAVAIYEWVRNNIAFQPCFGSWKGSQATLTSRTGNDYDQASLLLALLRALSIPSRYVSGTVDIPIDDAMNWLGVRDKFVPGSVLATAGIPAVTYVDGGGIPIFVRLDHVWVEMYVSLADYRGQGAGGYGEEWIHVDPSVKYRDYQEGIPNVPDSVTFDRMDFFSSIHLDLPYEAYLDSVRAYVERTYPGSSAADVPYRGPVIEHDLGLLPLSLPYTVQTISSELASLLPSDRYEVDLLVTSGVYGALVSTTLVLPEVALDRITVGWNDAGAMDSYIHEVFTRRGLTTPAYLVNQVPVIRVDGVTVATGVIPVPAGTQVTVRITANNPAGWSNSADHPYIYAGDDYAGVGLYHGQISNSLIEERSDSLITAVTRIGTPQEDQDDILGAFLHLAALVYWNEIEEADDALDGIFGYVRVRDVSEGLTTSDAIVSYLYDRPFAVAPDTLNNYAGVTIDVQLHVTTPISIDDDYGNHVALNQIAGASSSALEHQLWEELVLEESVSTIKALQVASEDGIPIYHFTIADCAIIYSTLNLDSQIETTIWNEVCLNGKHVIVHRDPITLNSWQGVGYITENPSTGMGGYIIWGGLTGLLAGGSSTGGDGPDEAGDGETDGNATSDDPVIFSNGGMIRTDVDLAIPVRGDYSLEIVRNYSSHLDYDGPFGYGWTHNYNQFLVEISSDSVMYFDANGGNKLYVKDLGGDFIVPPGEFVELVEAAPGWEIHQKPGRVLYFDATGTLQSLTDRNGNAITLGYTSGKLTTITDPVGRSITITYNVGDRIEQVQDFIGRTISYTYNVDGNLETVTDLRTGVHTYGYSSVSFAEHNLTSHTDPEGNVTQFDYYANDKAFRLTEAGGGKTLFYYSPFHYETRMVDYLGYESKHRYNDLGCITRITYPDDGVWESEWDSLAQRISVTDQEGYRTEYTYDARRNRNSVTDPRGYITTLTYNQTYDLITYIFDNLGNSTKMVRDQSTGNLLKLICPESKITTLTYDINGNLISTQDGEGNIITHLYDENGYHQSFYSASGDTFWTSYDEVGRLRLASNPLGESTEWVWRNGNDIDAVISQTGDSTKFTYDLNGNILSLQDPLDRITQFEFGTHLRTTKIENALGAITEYDHYDTRCNCQTPLITGVIDPLGGKVNFEYDFRGNPIRQIDALGHVESRTYDLRGNQSLRTDGNGNTIQYRYDRSNRLVKIEYPDGRSDMYQYDTNGNMIKARATSSEINFSYDANDRLTRVDNLTIPASLSYTYDDTGKISSLTIEGYGTLTYTYNDFNRLIGIRLADGDSIVLLRDAAQFRLRTDFPNGTYKEYNYDNAHRITSITHKKSDNSIFAQYTYTYDNIGNQSTITDVVGITSLDYDDIDQLLTVDRFGILEDEAYQYDLSMRRTSDASIAYNYNASNQLVRFGEYACLYDANGNLIQKDGPQGPTTYRYDFENRLIQVVTPTGNLIHYSYYPTGQLASRSINGNLRRYLYQGIDRVADYDAAGNLLAVYIHGSGIDEPLMIIQGGSPYTYHEDAMGSIVALASESESVEQSYRYDAYGNLLAELDQGFQNPYTFTGRIWDKEAGLYYFRMRYYDPTTGRFLTRDPLEYLTGTYLYGYARNNPINVSDPLGLWNIIIGGGGSLAGGMGAEGSAGIVISYWEKQFDIGVFGSVGASGGLNVSADVFVGWVKGGTDDLSGTTANINVTGGPVSVSSFHDPETGEWTGGTVGAGPGATPIGGSIAISKTGKITIGDIFQWIFDRLYKVNDKNKK